MANRDWQNRYVLYLNFKRHVRDTDPSSSVLVEFSCIRLTILRFADSEIIIGQWMTYPNQILWTTFSTMYIYVYMIYMNDTIKTQDCLYTASLTVPVQNPVHISCKQSCPGQQGAISVAHRPTPWLLQRPSGGVALPGNVSETSNLACEVSRKSWTSSSMVSSDTWVQILDDVVCRYMIYV